MWGYPVLLFVRCFFWTVSFNLALSLSLLLVFTFLSLSGHPRPLKANRPLKATQGHSKPQGQSATQGHSKPIGHSRPLKAIGHSRPLRATQGHSKPIGHSRPVKATQGQSKLEWPWVALSGLEWLNGQPAKNPPLRTQWINKWNKRNIKIKK